jgi:hypothetical protein
MFKVPAGPPSVTCRRDVVEPPLEPPDSSVSPHNIDISARHMGGGARLGLM